MPKDIQQWEAVKETSLTVSGGATPSATGEALDFGKVDSNFSLILENSGQSDDLSVTYQIGYLEKGMTEEQAKRNPDDFLKWITPADGGAVSSLTNVDCAGSAAHASLSLAVGKFYRFIVTNNSATKTATIRLSIIAQF